MTKALWKLVNLLLPLESPRRTFVALLLRPRHWIGLMGLFVLLMVRRFADVRVGLISADRIGHFVLDVAIRHGEALPSGRGRKTIYWVEGRVSNTFWFGLMKSNMTCHPIAKHISRLAPFFSSATEWFLPSPRWTVASRDLDGVVNRTQSRLSFSPHKDELARDWLRSVGWKEGEPIVCVLVRDATFLQTEPGQTPADFGLEPEAWDYHNYRNCDAQTFVPAMQWLAEQNALVLRMGKTMAVPLESAHPRVVDYAFHPGRSDFLDVWLFANCDLCVTTGTGPDMISVVFGRPVLCVNYLPISWAITSGRVVTAGKRLYSKSGKRLSLEDHFAASFLETKEYERAGLAIEDLKPGEILEIVKESWDNFVVHPSRGARDSELKSLFLHLLKHSPNSDVHGWIHPDANLSKVWVENLSQEVMGLEAKS